ncbi:hypothetical protein EZS27_030217 [termite gut metagenome]|uniref:Uncharacterized protein n=1 Tax=termite gut metagenome TaxID=433724 RepID=A0A5J4QFW6_9ZZZZ
MYTTNNTTEQQSLAQISVKTEDQYVEEISKLIKPLSEGKERFITGDQLKEDMYKYIDGLFSNESNV